MDVTLWRARTELARPVAAGPQRHATRDHLFLELREGEHVGYGEVAPQPTEVNGDPGVDDVVGEVEGPLRRRLGEIYHREGSLPDWSRTPALRDDRAASAWAWALLEMALLDLSLRSGGDDLVTRWGVGGSGETVATVSLIEATPWGDVAGASRVRAKVRPGGILPEMLERLGDLGRPVILDYNATAVDDDEVLATWRRVADVVPVVAVEQPYAPGNVAAHARLARRGIPLSMDEGVRSVADVRQIARYGAATMVCVKPARVGGVASARSLLREAGRLGLRSYVGGFFESELARGVTRALAAAECREPSDAAPVAFAGASPVEPLEGGLGWRPASARQELGARGV